MFYKFLKYNSLKQNNKKPAGKKKILYVGPSWFGEGIWDTLVTYTLPDIFKAVPEQFEIHLLASHPPEFATEGLNQLQIKYDIVLHEIRQKSKKITLQQHWINEVLYVSMKIKPVIITNIFGAVFMGLPMGRVAKKVGARMILRVAGDEIGSRIPIGVYDRNIEELDWDMAVQMLGFKLADTIIVISPLEKQRVCKELPKSEWEKVMVCMRGVDISRFLITPNDYAADPVSKFLYIGRKSMEKGFDILEKVADLVFKANKQIQFTFAGSFPPQKYKNRNYIGWIDSKDLPQTFSEHDAFIMASRTEGFPQAVSEAMSTGLPCILPRHLFDYVFTDGVEALLTSLEPDNIAQAVLRLHADKLLTQNLSIQARKFAETTLDKKKWSKAYHDILLGIEHRIPPPFCGSYQGTIDRDIAVSNKKQLRICFLISSGYISNRTIWIKLNRLIIEMVRRRHIIQLVVPENRQNDFSTAMDVEIKTCQNNAHVSNLIQELSPDLVILAATGEDRSDYFRNSYSSCFSMAVLDLEQTPHSTHFVLWEDEIIFSSVALIMSENINENYCSKHIWPLIKRYPKIVYKKDSGINTDQNANQALYQLDVLELQGWKILNNEMFDYIEKVFLYSVDNVDIPEQLFSKQLKRDKEKALHSRRMRKKMLQYNLKYNRG